MTTAYRPRRRRGATDRTRARILAVVRELLSEGTFHETTVEEVASRAGVARATLYQHFGTRVGLVDALCETFDATPALQATKQAAGIGDLDATITHCVDFWAGEETVLLPLYGVAAVDPAARALVERQRADRRATLKLLVSGLAGKLRVDERTALAHLLVLTSFETFEELRRHAGMSQRAVTAHLQHTARTLLLA